MDYTAFIANDEDLAAQAAQAVEDLNITVSDNLTALPRGVVNVAVVQLEISQFSSVKEFVTTLNDIVADAINQRAHIVCFPALTGWLALPFSSRFHRLLPSLQKHLATGNVSPHIVADMLSACSSDMMDVYMTTMSLLAQHHGIYIMGGTALYYEMHKAYHRAFLFDNFGSTIGFQDKLLPSFLESLFEVEPAGEVKVFDTLLGTVGMLITSDVNTFEPVRIEKNMGASLILCPEFFIGTQTPMDAADGANLRVMENAVYLVQPTLVGNTGLGFSLGKSASIYAPPEISLSPKTDSTLRTSGTQKGSRLFVTPLSFEDLEKGKNPLTQSRNPVLLKEYESNLR